MGLNHVMFLFFVFLSLFDILYALIVFVLLSFLREFHFFLPVKFSVYFKMYLCPRQRCFLERFFSSIEMLHSRSCMIYGKSFIIDGGWLLSY